MLRRFTQWNWIEAGLLVFPLSPFLGGLAVVGVTVAVWWRQWRELLNRPLVWGLGVFALLAVVSSLTAIDRTAALLGLFNFLPFLAVFAAVTCLIRSPSQLRQLAEVVVVSSIPVVVVGIGQMFFRWRGPIDLGWVLFWPLEPGGAPSGRMSSVFEYANVLANYAVIVWALGLGLWADAWRIPTGNLRWKRLLLWTVVLLGNTIVLLLTSSRNAWGVAFLCFVAYAVYLGWRWILLGLGAIAASVLGAAFLPDGSGGGWLRTIVPPYFWLRLSDRLHPDRPVELMRVTQWRFAWDLAIDRPFFGWGLRNFTALYESQMGLWLGHPHNLLLMLFAETGFTATLVLCGVVAWILFRGIQVFYILETREKLRLFAIINAFISTVLFHCLDVTLFDARINILGWILLASMEGFIRQKQQFIRNTL
ncbi:O-antigen ligase family protein [Baaleninema sp.]|uniref:O-antigen ligase family protein n=1 Tax=Baaleninema sp. TaxID=3101197 RepID=UPI003CFC28F3